MVITESGDSDVLKHQLNSAVLGTRKQHCPRQLQFQDHFLLTCVHAAVRRDGTRFSPPLSSIPTRFLGPTSLLMMQTCSGVSSSLPFASLARSLVWLTLRLGERDAAVLCGTAFSTTTCTSGSLKAVFLVWHCQGGRCIGTPCTKYLPLGLNFPLISKEKAQKTVKVSCRKSLQMNFKHFHLCNFF